MVFVSPSSKEVYCCFDEVGLARDIYVFNLSEILLMNMKSERSSSIFYVTESQMWVRNGF